MNFDLERCHIDLFYMLKSRHLKYGAHYIILNMKNDVNFLMQKIPLEAYIITRQTVRKGEECYWSIDLVFCSFPILS